MSLITSFADELSKIAGLRTGLAGAAAGGLIGERIADETGLAPAADVGEIAGGSLGAGLGRKYLVAGKHVFRPLVAKATVPLLAGAAVTGQGLKQIHRDIDDADAYARSIEEIGPGNPERWTG